MARKVLIAEDNVDISDMLRNYCIRAGHTVYQAFDGKQALEMVELIKPDLVLLDIMMPIYDGYYVCEEIRKKSRIPIIITSAISTEDEKLRMFELGADDYMTKPFSFKEAVCRVNAQLRRYYETASAVVDEKKCGALTVCSSRSEVRINGEILPLSVKEFKLLDFLTSNENTIFSKQKLMDEVWGIDEYIEENTVAVTVGRLRDKLSKNGINNLAQFGVSATSGRCKMRTSNKVSYEKSLKKLIDGEIDIPINYGVPKGDPLLDGMEKLRKKMLAAKIAEDNINDDIDAKIAGVAHDLKTPIATIAGYAECIQDGIDDKDYPSLILQKTQEMGAQVLGIVEGVRSAREDGEKTAVEIKSFFTKITKDIVAGVKDKKVKLKIKIIKKGYVYIDVKKIYRVVQNLITNAVKYSSEKVCKITVKGNIWGDRAYIRIKDNGIGIKKEDRENIFKKFYMADKSRSSGGSGLGLHICKEFIEEHGGEISVKSNGKKGSKFIFFLPITAKEEKGPFTKRFEKMGRIGKILLFFFFGWWLSAIYRFARYHETKSPSTLIAGMLGFLLIFPLSTIDIVSEIVYNRLTFLAD